ncbi:MAG: hypothetical protein WD555_03725 [Fulvivirga sp.]
MINLSRTEKPLGEPLMGDNEFINKEKIIKIVNQAKISYFLCLGISFAFLFTIFTSGFAQKPDPKDISKKYKKLSKILKKTMDIFFKLEIQKCII